MYSSRTVPSAARIPGLVALSLSLSLLSVAASAADFTDLGDLPGASPNRGSEARAISADGSVIVGGSQSAAGYIEAFRWTRETGMVGLGYLPGGFSSYANDVSADGAVIVGGGNSAIGPKAAFVWTKDKGMQPLADVLAQRGVKNISGWTLEEATGISADGKTVIGVGQSPEGFTEDFAANLADADTQPDAFTFADKDDVPPSTLVTSAAVTITGINTGAPVTVAGGEYSVGCTGANFTRIAGTVNKGQSICVRHKAAATGGTATDTILTIGRVVDTFTTTTVAAAGDGKSGKGGSAFDGLSLLALGLFGLYRRRSGTRRQG